MRQISIIILTFLLLTTAFIFAQKKLKVSEVYDYTPGDEIHFSYCIENWNNGCQFQEYFKKKVINKYYITSGDTLFYKFFVTKTQYKWFYNPQRLEYVSENKSETMEITELDSFVLDRHFVDTTGTSFSYIDSVYISADHNGKIVNHSYFSTNFEGGHDYTYIEGCGGWYGRYWSVPTEWHYNLAYCKNGSSSFGNPFTVGEHEITVSDEFINIFPNPVSDRLYISSNALLTGMEYQVVSTLNGDVLNGTIERELLALDLSFLLPGVYIFKLSGYSKVFIKS